MCLLWRWSLLPVGLQDFSQSMYSTPGMLPQPPCTQQEQLKFCFSLCGASSSLWEQELNAWGSQSTTRGAAWAVSCSTLTLEFQETSPEDGVCGSQRSQRGNGHVGFYSCTVSSSREVPTSLLSAQMPTSWFLSPLSFASKCFCCTPVISVPGTWTSSSLQFLSKMRNELAARGAAEEQAIPKGCCWNGERAQSFLLTISTEWRWHRAGEAFLHLLHGRAVLLFWLHSSACYWAHALQISLFV